MTVTSGLAFTLDQGDRLVFDFVDTGCGTVCGISVASNAVIRFTDSDCGTATNAGPANCSGGNTNTVADFSCGTNATCFLQAGPGGPNTELVVIVTGSPATLVVGSVIGAQLPLVVTDSSGITDLSGNSWNVAASSDRTIEPATGAGPVSTVATQTVSAGFANTLDLGDTFVIDFNQSVSVTGNAVVRVTDSDCGPVTQAGPATCTGGNTNGVFDIVCGTNATCTLQTGPAGPNSELVIVMAANPTVVAAGSTPGAQFPVVVTDSSGITSAGGLWNVLASPDHVMGPQGQ